MQKQANNYWPDSTAAQAAGLAASCPGRGIFVTTLILGIVLALFTTRGSTARGIDPIAGDPWDGALTMTASSLEDQAARADIIAVGRVTSQSSRSVPGSIDTDVTVAVEKTPKGQTGSS